MGSTVSTGRKAGAIRTANGTVFYALYEQTYSKNCYPHTPDWSCVGFGTGPQVVRRIFAIASDTCGGMLQRPGGYFTPTGYVASWMKALAAPGRQLDRPITVNVALQDLSAALDRLNQLGKPAVAQALARDRSYRIESLAAEADVFTALVDHGFWNYLDEHALTSGPATDLGWRPAASATAPAFELPGAYRIAGLENIVLQAQDRIYLGDWQYSLEAQFVERYGELEASAPGHYRTAFTALAAHFHTLPPLPESTRLHVDPAKGRDGFEGSLQFIAACLGPDGGPLSAVPASDRHHLGYLGDALTFDQPPAPATDSAQRVLALASA